MSGIATIATVKHLHFGGVELCSSQRVHYIFRPGRFLEPRFGRLLQFLFRNRILLDMSGKSRFTQIHTRMESSSHPGRQPIVKEICIISLHWTLGNINRRLLNGRNHMHLPTYHVQHTVGGLQLCYMFITFVACDTTLRIIGLSVVLQHWQLGGWQSSSPMQRMYRRPARVREDGGDKKSSSSGDSYNN